MFLLITSQAEQIILVVANEEIALNDKLIELALSHYADNCCAEIINKLKKFQDSLDNNHEMYVYAAHITDQYGFNVCSKSKRNRSAEAFHYRTCL